MLQFHFPPPPPPPQKKKKKKKKKKTIRKHCDTQENAFNKKFFSL